MPVIMALLRHNEGLPTYTETESESYMLFLYTILLRSTLSIFSVHVICVHVDRTEIKMLANNCRQSCKRNATSCEY